MKTNSLEGVINMTKEEFEALERCEKDEQTYLKNVLSNIQQKGIVIEGHIGTWHVIDSKYFMGDAIFLLEHDDFGDDVPCLIVNEYFKVLMDDVYNGFDDYC